MQTVSCTNRFFLLLCLLLISFGKAFAQSASFASGTAITCGTTTSPLPTVSAGNVSMPPRYYKTASCIDNDFSTTSTGMGQS